MGFGSLPGVAVAAGNVLTLCFDGEREGPVTIVARADPVALPVPAALPLLVVALGGRLRHGDHRAPGLSR